MDVFVIEGGRGLSGRTRVNGSKNAALPMMAASLLTDEATTLRGVPNLGDIQNMRRLLQLLGRESGGGTDGKPLRFISTDNDESHAPYDVVRTMRASICVLGPLLASRGKARISMPGGCAIGDRPVDIHLRGLRALGARITLERGDISAEAPGGRLIGARVYLGGPNGSTVLGTANVMSAATLARGKTIIECAACEPEIVNLAELLISMGARIKGAGTPRVEVEGVEHLGSGDVGVIADRIEAGTLVCAAAVTGSGVELENFPLDCLTAFTVACEEMGIAIEPMGEGPLMSRLVRVSPPARLSPVSVATQPHPGFPTDLQAQLIATACLADGNSVVTEKIFSERFLHVPELLRMGASIIRTGPTAVVTGVKELSGAPVMASDLRASACLVIAGLAAKGTTIVNRVYHLDRGYERLEQRLTQLGASIERVDEKALKAEEVFAA